MCFEGFDRLSNRDVEYGSHFRSEIRVVNSTKCWRNYTTMVNRETKATIEAADPRATGTSDLGGAHEFGRPLGAVFARSDLLPFITVVVPVRNEARFIARTIEQLVDQEYPGDRFEILVVEGRSVDETGAIARSLASVHPNVTVLDNPHYLSSAARNIGVRHARGDLIVVVDGHCELEGRDYLRNLVDAFERSAADCLGRPQPLDVTGATALQKAIAAARSSWLGHHPDSFIYSSEEQFVPAKSVAVAYRREVFDRVGEFDERFDACEDVELNHRIDRAGLRCFFTPAVRVLYFPRSSLRAPFPPDGPLRPGPGPAAAQAPRDLLARRLHPRGLAGRPGRWDRWPGSSGRHSGGFMAAWSRSTATAVPATSASIALRHREPRFLGWLPVVFLTLHAGSGWGVLLELFRPRTSAELKVSLPESAPSAS